MHDTHWHMQPHPAKAFMLAKRQLSEFVYALISGENSTQALLDTIKASPRASKPKRSKAQQAELF